MNMVIHQTTNKSYLIVAVGSLTVKHMFVHIAIANIPVAAGIRSPATAVFPRRDTVTLFLRRDTVTLRASKPPRGGMTRLRGHRD
ncbi:MAG: hypothetical protein WBW81_05335 [Methylocella sp.]